MQKISEREKEILISISNGLTIKQIAKRLYLSVNTIASHRKNLVAKLGAANSPQLVRIGFKLGYLSLND